MQDLDNSHKVIIHGYEERFLTMSEVQVFLDGKEICRVGYKEKKEISLPGDNLLKFKFQIRTTKVMIRKDVHNHVLLSINRFSGALNAHLANDETMENAEKIKKANAKKNAIKSALFLMALYVFWDVLETILAS